MSRTSGSRLFILLITTSVTGLLLQCLLTASAAGVALAYISISQEDNVGYEGGEGESTGMDCLSPDGRGYSVESKLYALSCIGLHTSYSRWANLTDRLADCITISPPRSQGVADEATCAWLRPGNWRCSILPFVKGPHAACLRHDLNYSTLQSLDGNGGFHKLDEF